MRARSRARLTAGITLAATLAAFGALAGDDDHDHDKARQALERGEALPLETILSEVRKSVPGEVVGIELEREHGAWVYEIKVIRPGGMRTEVLVEAGSGRIIATKEK